MAFNWHRELQILTTIGHHKLDDEVTKKVEQLNFKDCPQCAEHDLNKIENTIAETLVASFLIP